MTVNFVYAMGTERVHLPRGDSIMVPRGSMVPDTDPVVRARPDLFSADPRYCASLFGTVAPEGLGPDDPPIETATAAPGERRSARRPAS